MRTRVKICGITRPEDGLQAAALGADAIGLVFYEKSSRAVSIDEATQIQRALPAFVSVVGLFVNPEASQVHQVLQQVHVDCLQFHGEETPAFCESFGLPYMKAIRVREGLDIKLEISKYSKACAILLDSFDKNSAGGTGLQFEWSIAQEIVLAGCERIVLAGGLSSENVARAIRQVRPYAVDVSSGVESAPGYKSPERLTAFFHEVRSV